MVGGIRRAPSFAVAVLVGLVVAPMRASAQPSSSAEPSAADLEAARGLFAEALSDEKAGRFSEALRKFEEVRAVRDTPAVEYRIGACEEGLRALARAYIAYRQATRLGGSDPAVADVVVAARARVDSLTMNVGQLELRLPAPAPPDLEVRVDGELVPVASLVEPLVLEPGRHDVTARFGARATVHDDVVLPEGGQVALTLAEPTVPAPPPPPPIPSRPAPARTAAIATLAGAGVLEAAAIVLALVREAEISKLNRTCPQGSCPPGSDRNDLEATRSRALAEGPVAIALGAAGLVAGGIGVYLAVAPGPAPPSGACALPLVAGAGLRGSFP
jgi:hypothetical protein